MKNSSASAKSRGVVLFAYNTDTVDYVKIANIASNLIKHTLGLPVTVISDSTTSNTLVNRRTGYANGTAWRNGNRYLAYELSPYNETLLLDSDYLQLDTSLLKLFDVTADYRIVRDNRFINSSHSELMGPISIPFVWATAVVFKKTAKTQQLFELVGRIQRNYSYYRQLYHITAPNFRNDYAFAIADNIINGYTINPQHAVPGTMLTVDNPVKNIELKNNKLIVRQDKSAHVLPKQNIHIMDKDYLLSDDFENFVNTVCQE